MWDLVWFALGLVAFVLIFQLLDLPDWIRAYLKLKLRRNRPTQELERQVADLSKRVAELENRPKT
ncbi:MAG: hypothetical protein ACOYLV_12245 [Rubrivivax sp.]|jgi:hypothetical protein